MVRRADIVLAAAEGLNNNAISVGGLGSVQTICLWRKRYAEYGIEGLQDEPKPGRPREIGQEKVVDIVGLYLNPPQRALVLGVDEKNQIRALQRTQPLLPLSPGEAERHTHDYKRNGTTTLLIPLVELSVRY